MATSHNQPRNIEPPLPRIPGEYVSPHYEWTRTGPTTLRIAIIDDEHFTFWTVAPDIMGTWNLHDTSGVPLDLVRPDYTSTPYPNPGRAIDAAQDVKGGEKVYHCGGGIVYHRHDEKELNWEPGGVRSGTGVRRCGVSQESSGSP